jgi:hypothetical protein
MNNDQTNPKSRENIKWYKKIKGRWWFIIIIFILSNLCTALISNRILPPKLPSPNIDITYNFMETIAKKPDFSGLLRVDYESDQNITGLQIFIRNNGDKHAKDMEFKICTISKEIQIEPVTIIFDPTTLNEHIVKSIDYNKGINGFYRKLDVFHSDSTIYIEIWPKKNITENDIKFEIVSELKKWKPQKGNIEYKQSERNSSFFSKSLLFNQAFAEDFPENAAIESNSSGKSGILIGGYDPVIMTNNLFGILQKENLIDKYEAQEIKDIVEGEKKGVLFGGINILKFNEIVLNALIKNGKISKKEALAIILKSKNSGGILVGGYNVIVLEIETMNTLIKNGFLDLETAQSVVDKAKSATPK